MDDLTPDDKIRAIKISKALQTFFGQNPGTPLLRSTDAYHVLVTKKLVERDRHQGFFFRKFLGKLKKAGAMAYIPQCHPEPGNRKHTDWYFRPAKSKTPAAANLRPAGQPAPATDENKIREIRLAVAQLSKRDTKDFGPIQLEKRKTYPRAYEYWSVAEEALLKKGSQLLTDPFQLADLFGRQPSVLEKKVQSFKDL